MKQYGVPPAGAATLTAPPGEPPPPGIVLPLRASAPTERALLYPCGGGGAAAPEHVSVACGLDPAPPQLHAALLSGAAGKLKQPLLRTVVLGFLAGVFIGFGAHAATSAMTVPGQNPFEKGNEPTGLTKLAGGLIFAHGLMFVLITGGQLFTGDVLILSAVLSRKGSVRAMLSDWATVWIANFAGSVFCAALVYGSKLNGWTAELTATGEMACYLAYTKSMAAYPTKDACVGVFFRGVLCNISVCLAVMQATASRSVAGKVLGILFPIAAFVVMGFEHSVANQYFMTMGGLLEDCGKPHDMNGTGVPIPGVQKSFSFWQHGLPNIMFATLGNTVGAALLAALYWVAFLRTGTGEKPYLSASGTVDH